MTMELSASHHIITTLHGIIQANEAVARIAVEQLFDNANIAAGTLDDPRVLMSRLNKVLEMFVYQGAGFDYAKGEYTKTLEAEPSEAPKAEVPKAEPEKNEASKEPTSKFEE